MPTTPAPSSRVPAIAAVGAVSLLLSGCLSSGADPGSVRTNAAGRPTTAGPASPTTAASPSPTASKRPTTAAPSSSVDGAGTQAAQGGPPAKIASTNPSSWPAVTVRVASSAGLRSAIEHAAPGAVIGLAPGTYSGQISIERSGTSTKPITLRPVTAGTVTLTASLPMRGCGSVGPDPERTLTFRKGASYWQVLGLAVRGGVMISSENADKVQNWFAGRIDAKDWQSRRAVPGRSAYDATAARSAVSYLSAKVHATVHPSDGIALVGNTITVKGIHTRLARYGTISGNTITDIACGTGPGLWLNLFSDGWTVSGNRVSRVAHSTAAHFMQEGIRIGDASAYNTVTGNTVTALPSGGRAFSTDQDGSFNTLSRNLADGVDIGFNEQMSGWQNTWDHNTARNYRVAGYSLRMMDGRLTAPSMNTSSYRTIMKCNIAAGGRDFQAGGIKSVVMSSNGFDNVFLGKNVRAYFTAQHNVWNGSTRAPSATPTADRANC